MTPTELLTRVEADADDVTWWARYRRAAAAAGLSETALRVLDLDAEYILSNGVLGAGHPADPANTWPATRVRRGLVVGSVQSGKTASILGVTAKGLDAKIDVVVLLTGTRVALWRQTLERVLGQLDGWNQKSTGLRGQHRLLIPDPGLFRTDGQAPGLDSLYHLNGAQVRRAFEKGRPVIAVVMKQADHLIRFGNELRDAVAGALTRINRPAHLLVVDDEADDGSILDAVVEAGLGPDAEGLKQIPRHITRLWADRAEMRHTFHDDLFATYLAYTATPQSNFLQSDHNPLSPREFVAALRTPLDRGEVDPPRTPTFKEPRGVTRYYTGGEVFYRRISNDAGSLCETLELPQRVDFDSDDAHRAAVGRRQLEHLGHSLRAYFVAAALRMLESGKRISNVQGQGLTLEQLGADSPAPCCMLVHPSAITDAHLWTARLISAWSHDPSFTSDEPTSALEDPDGRPVLDPEGLALRLERESDEWRAWLGAFESTRRRLDTEFPGYPARAIGEDQWDEVRSILLEEVFPFARLSIVNSSPIADDRPRFDPVPDDEGAFCVAPDLISIFVSGNVMSRGVTLEGLTTTLFLRGSTAPSADTQMQMQRWFGYRGSHLHWCRVFLFEDQLELFDAYHENDEALKGEVLAEMNRSEGSLPSPLVLEGPRFRATSKIANLGALPLCPGRQPFIRVLGSGAPARENVRILLELLEESEWEPLVVRGTERGLLRDGRLSLIQVADILERFRYDDHSPTPEGRNHRRWASLSKSLDIEEPVSPLFRPPRHEGPSADLISPAGCPYSIAAYLRLWSAALTRRAPGLVPTDDYSTPWSLINLAMYAGQAPRFFVGVRSGDQGPPEDPVIASHGVRRVERSHEGSILKATWGSRNPSEAADAYLGDHLFDYHVNELHPPHEDATGRVWRPRGHPGLLLFHVVRTADGDRLTAGLCLPLGGPDHFAAIAPREAGNLG